MCEHDPDNCDLCDGTGEIEAATIHDIGSVPCPTCVSAELRERIVRLENSMSRIARAAGIGSASMQHAGSHRALLDILDIAKQEGFDLLGMHIRDAARLAAQREETS